jgi:hypothetical protein
MVMLFMLYAHRIFHIIFDLLSNVINYQKKVQVIIINLAMRKKDENWGNFNYEIFETDFDFEIVKLLIISTCQIAKVKEIKKQK